MGLLNSNFLYCKQQKCCCLISFLSPSDLPPLLYQISLQSTIETHSNLGSNSRFLPSLLISLLKLAWVPILNWNLLLYQPLVCQDSNTIEGELSFCFILQFLLVNPWVWCLMLGSWISLILGLIFSWIFSPHSLSLLPTCCP